MENFTDTENLLPILQKIRNSDNWEADLTITDPYDQ